MMLKKAAKDGKIVAMKDAISTASFDWKDPLLLNKELQEDERMARDQARNFFRNDLFPKTRDLFRAESFDRAIMQEMGRMGLLGIMLPEKYGGSDMSHVLYGLLMREAEWVDSGFRSVMSVQNSLASYPILTYGTEDQRQRLLPGMASGETVGCFGLTEPDFGSDAGGLTTRAKKAKGGYVLNGGKAWITNAPIADLAVIWAKDEEDVIRGFIVERGMKGFETHKIEGKFSLRVSLTGSISLTDVFVPEENLLPHTKGLTGPFSCLNKARYGICWGAMGAAEFCWHAARDYVMERKQFGNLLGSYQLVQKKLADMQMEITLGLWGVLRLGRLLDQEDAAAPAISLLKRNNCGKALEIARVARDMHGANGVSDEYHVIRHVLNLEAVNTYEGTHDVHALILGRTQTGIQAFT